MRNGAGFYFQTTFFYRVLLETSAMLRQRPRWISFACWLLFLAAASEAQATDALGWMNPELTALRLEKEALEERLRHGGPSRLGRPAQKLGRSI